MKLALSTHFENESQHFLIFEMLPTWTEMIPDSCSRCMTNTGTGELDHCHITNVLTSERTMTIESIDVIVCTFPGKTSKTPYQQDLALVAGGSVVSVTSIFHQ